MAARALDELDVGASHQLRSDNLPEVSGDRVIDEELHRDRSRPLRLEAQPQPGPDRAEIFLEWPSHCLVEQGRCDHPRDSEGSLAPPVQRHEVPDARMVDQAPRVDGAHARAGGARASVGQANPATRLRRLAQQRQQWHRLGGREPTTPVRPQHRAERLGPLEGIGRGGCRDFRESTGELRAQPEVSNALPAGPREQRLGLGKGQTAGVRGEPAQEPASAV